MTASEPLSTAFHHIRLLLAREKGHPAGDHTAGYDLLAPLNKDGLLDAAEWRAHQTDCRVRRFDAGAEERIGCLKRRPGGQWYFDYSEGDFDDEIGFRLGQERFRTGEYVSIGGGGAMHTYQVARVEKP